jgi:hypothetical protein
MMGTVVEACEGYVEVAQEAERLIDGRLKSILAKKSPSYARLVRDDNYQVTRRR